jgi:GGDEF domain-containing protein
MPANATLVALPEPAVAPRDFQQTLGRDEVTGLPNRPRFSHLLAHQAELAQQLQTQLSVLVIDWPGYRRGAGPVPMRKYRLTAIASRLQETLQRKHDVIGSLGDGRLAAMLPFTDASGADRVARNLARAANDILQNAASPPGRPQGIWPADKPFGRGTPEEDANDAEDAPPHPVLTSASDIELVAVGLASYCGKGPANGERLLQGAEQAALVAVHDTTDRIARF